MRLSVFNTRPFVVKVAASDHLIAGLRAENHISSALGAKTFILVMNMTVSLITPPINNGFHVYVLRKCALLSASGE
jgi:hypothetical protein